MAKKMKDWTRRLKEYETEFPEMKTNDEIRKLKDKRNALYGEIQKLDNAIDKLELECNEAPNIIGKPIDWEGNAIMPSKLETFRTGLGITGWILHEDMEDASCTYDQVTVPWNRISDIILLDDAELKDRTESAVQTILEKMKTAAS